jgi:hypothetical protein
MPFDIIYGPFVTWKARQAAKTDETDRLDNFSWALTRALNRTAPPELARPGKHTTNAMVHFYTLVFPSVFGSKIPIYGPCMILGSGYPCLREPPITAITSQFGLSLGFHGLVHSHDSRAPRLRAVSARELNRLYSTESYCSLSCNMPSVRYCKDEQFTFGRRGMCG